MEFLNRLDQEQEQNALLIARKAKEMGVDPRLAVALAFQESSLRHGKTGEAGEIGIMQVRPTTAKMIGFDPKELNNPEQNIQIGLTYLKQGMDRYKDPVLAAAGYNAGMDHPFFADPSKELPKSTMSYLESIKGLGAFTEAPPASTQEAAPTSPSGTVTVSDQDFQMDKARALIGGAGAIAGAVGAKSLDLLSEYGKGRAADKQAVRDIAGILKNVTAAAPTSGPVGGPVGGPAGPVSSGLPPAQGPLSNAPAGGRMTQNWMRSQDAAGAYELEAQKARDLKEAHQMKRAAMAAEDKIRAIAPEMRQVPERAGLFLPESAGRGPRGAPNVPIPPAAPPAAPPPPGALQRIGSAVSKIPGAVLGSPMVSGALGGLGATEMGMQAAERYSADDPIGAAIAGVGAAGGALAMAPHPAAKIVGGGLAAASPLTLYLYDKLKTKPYPEPLGIREAYIYGPSR